MPIRQKIWYPLNQAKQEFWKQIKDSCNKVAASIDLNNLDVHSLSLSLEPLKGWLGTFQLLSPPKKQALMEEQNPDLQVHGHRMVVTFCFFSQSVFNLSANVVAFVLALCPVAFSVGGVDA